MLTTEWAETRWRALGGLLPNAPVGLTAEIFAVGFLRGEKAGNPTGKWVAKLALME